MQNEVRNCGREIPLMGPPEKAEVNDKLNLPGVYEGNSVNKNTTGTPTQESTASQYLPSCEVGATKSTPELFPEFPALPPTAQSEAGSQLEKILNRPLPTASTETDDFLKKHYKYVPRTWSERP